MIAKIAAIDFETWRIIIAVVSVLILCVAIYGASKLDRTAKPMAINGDTVGRDTYESLEEYQARTANALVNSECTSPCYALVTFKELQPTAAAGAMLESAHIGRVNALILDDAPPIPIPEPVAGSNRAVVFDRAIAEYARPRALNPSDPSLWVRGVVVYSPAQPLIQLGTEHSAEIVAIDILPPGAVWGRFGVLPVMTGRLDWQQQLGLTPEQMLGLNPAQPAPAAPEPAPVPAPAPAPEPAPAPAPGVPGPAPTLPPPAPTLPPPQPLPAPAPAPAPAQ